MSVTKFTTSNEQRIKFDTIADLSRDVHRNKVPEKIAMQTADAELSDYSVEGGLNPILANFTETILGVSQKHLQSFALNDPKTSSDKLYIVKNLENHESYLVFKVFQQNSKNFFRELFSLQFLSEQKIKDFLTPDPRALGKCVLQDKQYFLLCKSVPLGRSLLYYYKDRHQFMVLEKAVTECGKALAALHSHFPQRKKGIPVALEEIACLNFNRAIAKLTLFPQEGIPLEKLNQLFRSILKLLREDTFFIGFTHGKPSLANVFYETESGKITWIDLPMLAKSVDADLMSSGFLAKDFHLFITDMKFRRVGYTSHSERGLLSHTYMQEKKVEQLINAFYMGYIQNRKSPNIGVPVPGRIQIEFFKLKSYFSKISKTTTFDPDCSLAEPKRSIEKYEIRLILDELRLMLKSFQPP